MKGLKKLIFFRGAIFEITFNKEGRNINSQGEFLFDFLPQEYLARWLKIKTLKYSLGLINTELDPNAPKETYLLQGFVEVEIGIAPERTQLLGNNTQAKR